MNQKSTTANYFQKSHQSIGVWMMALSVSFFTTHTLLLKWVMSLREQNPAVPLFFRALVGGIVVFALFSRTKPNRRPLFVRPVFTHRKLIFRGLSGIIGTAAFYYTIPKLGIGKASLILSTYVLFAAIIAAIFLKEALKIKQAIWLMIAFVGIALLLSNQAGTFQFSIGRYEVIGLFGAAMAATTVVLIRDLTKHFSAGTIFLAQCIWVGLPILPFALPKLAALTPIDYVGLIGVGITAAGGQLCMNEGYRRLSVTVGSAIQNVTPVFITLGGIFLFGESLTVTQMIGGALILAGTFFVSRKSK